MYAVRKKRQDAAPPVAGKIRPVIAPLVLVFVIQERRSVVLLVAQEGSSALTAFVAIQIEQDVLGAFVVQVARPALTADALVIIAALSAALVIRHVLMAFAPIVQVVSPHVTGNVVKQGTSVKRGNVSAAQTI